MPQENESAFHLDRNIWNATCNYRLRKFLYKGKFNWTTGNSSPSHTDVFLQREWVNVLTGEKEWRDTETIYEYQD